MPDEDNTGPGMDCLLAAEAEQRIRGGVSWKYVTSGGVGERETGRKVRERNKR